MKASMTLHALLLAFAVQGCATRSLQAVIEEPNIREAIFQDQLKEFEARDEQVYLSIRADGRRLDPDDAFVSRFAEARPRPKAVSQCRPSIEGVVDRTTGVRGIVLESGPIKWLSATEVEAFGGWFRNGRNSVSYLYRLVKVNGTWTVIRRVLYAIS